MHGSENVKNCTLTSFVVVGMPPQRNVTKIGEPSLVSPWRQCCSTPVSFGQGFLSK